MKIIKQQIKVSQSVIFNDNGYDEKWREEAKKRKLPFFDSVLKCYQQLTKPEVKNLFESEQVLNEKEVSLRYEILLERYINSAVLDAKVLIKMVNGQLLPALQKQVNQIPSSHGTKYEQSVKSQLTKGINALFEKCNSLQDLVQKIKTLSHLEEQCLSCEKQLLPALNAIRARYDELEPLIPRAELPFPDYDALLYDC